MNLKTDDAGGVGGGQGSKQERRRQTTTTTTRLKGKAKAVELEDKKNQSKRHTRRGEEMCVTKNFFFESVIFKTCMVCAYHVMVRVFLSQEKTQD